MRRQRCEVCPSCPLAQQWTCPRGAQVLRRSSVRAARTSDDAQRLPDSSGHLERRARALPSSHRNEPAEWYILLVLIDPRTFRRVVEVREHLLADDDVALADLADHVGMSPSRLIRVFAALFGTTPHQLRTQARIDRARQRLAQGAHVTDVCMEVGFSSLGSFSALFTRWTGTPPSRYRRTVQVPARIGDPPIVPGCLGMLARLPRNFREASFR